MEKESKSLEIARLLVQELQNSNEPYAREQLYSWLEQSEENRKLFEWLQQDAIVNQELNYFAAQDSKAAWKQLASLLQIDQELNPKPVVFWKKVSFQIAAALIVVMVLSVLLYWVVGKEDTTARETAVKIVPEYKNDVEPGGNRALLTLADGSVVELEEVVDGTTISVQGTTEVKKLGSGELVYTSKKRGEQAAAGINVLSTPRGGQYHIVLPDGSEVWLNAATTLKYPSSFQGKERVVELDGEAYFEVRTNPRMPFRVITKFQKTTVLGTRFNVSAYHDEPAEVVTLAEGRVQLTGSRSSFDQSIELKPGYEAVVANQINTRIANVKRATAWKNGTFQFEDTELPVIMRQLARWYDVDVQYMNQEAKVKFSGTLPRSISLNSLLKILDLSDVKFRVEGRTITVL
jgi:transmembrane sensor